MKTEALFDVRGLAVAITGGASGIGFAFGEALADNGARVTLTDIDASGLETAVARLKQAGGDVRGEVLDVTDRAAVRRVIDAIAVHYGRLDVVFANAGIDPGPGFMRIDGTLAPEHAYEKYPDAMWDKVIATNLTSVHTTIQAAVPHMRRQRSGRIIVTTSVAAIIPESFIAASYMAAKAAAAHLVQQAALELGPHNILVNAVAPGGVITNIGGGHSRTRPVQAMFERTCPLGRIATTDELQGIALFLASPASSYVTGTQIVIDGGKALGMTLGALAPA